ATSRDSLDIADAEHPAASGCAHTRQPPGVLPMANRLGGNADGQCRFSGGQDLELHGAWHTRQLAGTRMVCERPCVAETEETEETEVIRRRGARSSYNDWT